MVNILLFTGFYTSQVVQDFVHQQYHWFSTPKLNKFIDLPRNCRLQPGVKKTVGPLKHVVGKGYLQDARPPTRKISSSSLEAHGKLIFFSVSSEKKNATKTQKEELRGMNWVEWTTEKPEQLVGTTPYVLIHMIHFVYFAPMKTCYNMGWPLVSTCGSCM